MDNAFQIHHSRRARNRSGGSAVVYATCGASPVLAQARGAAPQACRDYDSAVRRLRSLRPGDWSIAVGVAVIAMLGAHQIGSMLLGSAPRRSTAWAWGLAFPFVVLLIGLPVLVGLLALQPTRAGMAPPIAPLRPPRTGRPVRGSRRSEPADPAGGSARLARTPQGQRRQPAILITGTRGAFSAMRHTSHEDHAHGRGAVWRWLECCGFCSGAGESA